MNATQDLTEIARRLRQDPQEIARNAARGGQRVVGFVGNDVPVALILASGSLPVRLRVVASAATEGADRFVEGSFAPEVRVIANQWLQGVYDHLHAVVFARSDDSAQRLYYYLCELQRRRLCAGPLPLLYDIAGLARDASFEHTLDSTRLLASQLGASTSALAPAIERVSQRAALLRAVRERRLLPAPLPGSAAWAFSHASDCDWRAEFDDAGHRWLDDVATMPGAKRIVLAGDLPPGDQLHLAIEAAGASVVLELNESASAGPTVPREPLAAIADEFHRRESPALSMRRQPRWLADCALSHRADAVLVWLSEENEALPWEIARQMQALRAAGIPALLLSRQPPDFSPSVLEQVTAFVRSPGALR